MENHIFWGTNTQIMLSNVLCLVDKEQDKCKMVLYIDISDGSSELYGQKKR